MFEGINIRNVVEHYNKRENAHKLLTRYFANEKVDDYCQLALGIELPEGNYSASEHFLGPKVLSASPASSVFQLASKLKSAQDVNHVPKTIYDSNLPYLRISVGSEIAMMLNPNDFWVGNVRTIYTHLIIKHKGNISLANEELALYKEPEPNKSRPSKMEYQIWRDLYLSLEPSLIQLTNMGRDIAESEGLESGSKCFMWADALCSEIYATYT
ncbi:hypothetical protein L1D94_24030 [Vibrio alginolyticus]|uniref:hypothetical protein n=1 Tax=Vibrio TaxID=662 RepID=UPI00039FF019|nr:MULTISPECIES: hypothetical protein [Vibrio]CDT88662.1 Conserved hypothetical protein [Vibrio diabolicus]HDY7974453.1 hypothetical protein [Vibrio vulnificus]MBY7704086.1 hypothetical protein [Vibrio harveyi]MCG9719655.1 hypothetical protein [Vibrio alginolyticus]MDW1872798.1 hypothetical protein [Vibrio sp. Vb0598]